MNFRTAITLLGVLIISASARAQQNDEPVNIYHLPNGQRLPDDKVDSVIQSWGGKFNMSKKIYGQDSVAITLLPVTPAMDKSEAEQTARELAGIKQLIGQPAKDFTLFDANGKRYRLSDLKGKIVVLNFWFTTCSPCVAEMPALNQLTERYDASKVLFLALTYNDPQTVKGFLKHHAFKYHILPNAKPIEQLYGIPSYPASFVIDQKGTIRQAALSDPQIAGLLTRSIDALLP